MPGPKKRNTPARSRVRVRPATPADAGAIARIYNHYVTATVVTFEDEPVSRAAMAARLQAVAAAGLPWLVAEQDGEVAGYAYGSYWKSRSAYRFAIEITVYLDPARTGQGLGTRLYEQLLPRLRRRRVHAVVGCIALPNDASVALHEKFGLAKVAHFPEVGFKFDRWIDVGYWQRLL
jgi:L-amino acid N-acyltransferase YncA